MTNPDDFRRKALESIPDIARWVEARAVLLADCGRYWGDNDGWVIRNEQEGARMVVVVERPAPELIRQGLHGRPHAHVLCAPEDRAMLAGLLPGWSIESAILYRLAHPELIPHGVEQLRLLESDDSLEHLPKELREEMQQARGNYEVHTAFVDDQAASFAYAYWQTEGQFDISIDTAPAFQRRGLAGIAAGGLIRAQMSRGLRPVWGAMQSNLASQRLAEKLGFIPFDEILLFENK